MGFVGGDVQHLHAAAASLGRLVNDVESVAGAVSDTGRRAAISAGSPSLDLAITDLARELMKATNGTAMVVGELGSIAEAATGNLRTATG
jgi:hypothetical protein